jgi:PAS domain S-box-containing protein
MCAKAIARPARSSTVRWLTPFLIAVAATASAAMLMWALWSSNKSVVVADGGLPATAQAYMLITFCLVSSVIVLLIARVRVNERAQKTLREQAELIDHAQRFGRMGSWKIDVHTGRLACPAATCQLFGIAPAEFDGTFEQFHRLILPEDVADYDAAQARLSSTHPVFEAEYRIRRPDGEVRWIYSRGRLDTDATGAHTGRSGIVMDVTDEHAATERSAETGALLRIAGKVAQLGGWTIQLPSRALTWSDETCAIHDLPAGYQPTLDEGIGYFPPEYRAEVLAYVTACERDGTGYDFEVPKITATGRRIWVRSIGEAVRDADGRIVALQGAFQDISTRRHAEQALRDSEAQLRTLAESMPQMVWMTRPDGWNTYVNQRWVDYTGLSLEDGYGHGWTTSFHPDDRHRAWDAWQLAIAGGDYGDVESRLRAADGSYRWMLIRALPLRDGAGDIVKWIGTCTDIDDLKQAQEAALRSEGLQRALAAELETERARLVAAQAVAGIGSWEIDFATGALTFSAEFQRILGASTQQLPQSPEDFLRQVHADDRSAVHDAFIRALDQHLPGAVEYRLVMPDGRVKVIEGRWQIARDEHGVPRRAIGTCQDMTERRQAQDAIRTQAHMLDQIGLAVMATDTEGRVTYANRFANELYGFDAAEMVGRDITNTVQQMSPRHDEILAHVKRGDTWSGECLVQSRQGRVFPAFETMSPVLDGRGQLIAMVGISIDITARKQAEDEARQKDTLIRMAGRLTQTGGWSIELPSEQIFWSDEVFDILDFPRGHPPTLAEGLTLYPDPWREKIASAIQTCGRDGTPFDIEIEVVTGKGTRKWVRVTAEAERGADGLSTRVQGAFQDITERRRLEQQYLRAQRMESIGTLASGIAHDLNNALAPILLSIGLLHAGEHDAERLETLDTIEASAKRGAAMVGLLLSFARGADGRREEVQMRPLVRDLATIVRDTFPKNIVFEAHLSPDLWALQADATQLHQVLINLCVNARDAMPAGGQITVTAKNIVLDQAYAALNIDARPGPYVTLSVEDTGTGIPQEIIDQIFDPFFTTKEIGKGTGLGLATSMAIVTGHKGFMRVHSTPGTGTRFDVFLPAQKTHAQRAAPVPVLAHPTGAGEMVLVVDDEAGIRQIAGRTLEAAGYRVLLASDGAEAVALYRQHQADIAVVLTDMMMPRMDGTATIQELVRLHPQVRIIAASGLAIDARAAGAATARVMYFLPKPYTASTLLTAIRAALPQPPGRKSE